MLTCAYMHRHIMVDLRVYFRHNCFSIWMVDLCRGPGFGFRFVCLAKYGFDLLRSKNWEETVLSPPVEAKAGAAQASTALSL